ncbi:MAG: hypothetical protein V7603_2165, partial [Micromonosporaceae bacterium]
MEQVQAWVELAELSLDPDFRASVRRMAEDQAAEQARSDTMILHRDFATVVREQAGPALAADIDPASRRADRIVTALTAHYAHVLGRPDDVERRRRLLPRLESVNDPRRWCPVRWCRGSRREGAGRARSGPVRGSMQ